MVENHGGNISRRENGNKLNVLIIYVSLYKTRVLISTVSIDE